MESLVSLNCSEPVVCNSPSPTASIWQDILAQAVTGELMAAMNYTRTVDHLRRPRRSCRRPGARTGRTGTRRGIRCRRPQDRSRCSQQCQRAGTGSGFANHSCADRGARLHRLPDRSGDHARIVRGRQLYARRQGRSGQSRQDLCRHCRGGRRAHRARDGDSAERSVPGTHSASMTRCIGFIST